MVTTMSSPGSSVDERRSVAEAPSSSTSFEDLAATKRFVLKEVEGKGTGMIAVSSISIGDVIISEAPVLTCPNSTTDALYMENLLREQLERLPFNDRVFLENLTDSFNHPEAPLTGRVRTNSLPCGRNGTHGAIFRNIAMANHDCIPNAVYYWDPRAKKGELYALTDIAPHEEICICYIDMLPHKPRQKQLESLFGFTCVCKLCKLSKKERRQEDCRIREITTLQAELFNDPMDLLGKPDQSLVKFQRLAVLYEESFIDYDRDLTSLWAAIADLCVAKYEPHRAVEKVMQLTEMPMNEAEEIVEAWFAEFEDEL